MTEKTANGGRKQLILMMLVAAISLGGSYWLYYAARSGGVWGTTNVGEFVQPPQDATALSIVDAEGQPLPAPGTWWLWIVGEGPCGNACAHAADQLARIQLLLNKDADRVRRAVVTPAAVPTGSLAAQFPDLVWLTGDVSALREGIYIVDPIGNLVLWYPVDAPSKSILDDLKKLLKVSQIG